MTHEQALAFALLGATIGLFIWGKLRYDLVALSALVAGALLGLIPADEMFAGFSNELIWIIASALILSAAIARSGIIERMLDPVLARLSGPNLQVPFFVGAVTLLSMLMKNVGALAIAMPIALRNARKSSVSPSLFLMPMAFASLLGGLVTLVGTSPNVIVSSVRQSLTGAPFEMFDFAPVGLGVCAGGFLFLAIAPRFIRIYRTPTSDIESSLADARYTTEMALNEESESIGKSVSELGAKAKDDSKIISLICNGKRQALKPDYVLAVGDRLLVEGNQESLERFANAAKLKLVGERHRSEAETGARLIETVIPEHSSLVGRSVAGERVHERYGLSLIAVSREGRRITQELRSIRLRAGDVALFKVEEERAGDALADLHLLPLSERGIALGQKRPGYAPLLILGAAILAIALGWAPVALAFPAAAVAILLLRVLTMADAYRAIEGPVLVLLAALIPISQSIQRTGGDEFVAAFLSQVLGPMPPFAGIAMLIATAMAVTPFLNNAATVLIVAPVAAATAHSLNVNPDAYLMAVAIGAACDFLTPIGHQCNTLVMGPGGYKFGDYWKLGLPLSVIVVLIATPLILMTWPLHR